MGEGKGESEKRETEKRKKAIERECDAALSGGVRISRDIYVDT